ncbi:unnamed protein product [Caenorhabditis bovis]|uniref:DEAD/DEAH box helicase n=1 Tax=Caenorhabditis bovis TaxID=2654633 RepID=A0A8S1EGU7_9PELO|nr:unnamed protein product [Caenorhabditis bovis]
MSSQKDWDEDSDSENDNVVVEEKPMILPRARQPSIAKSLEKVQILENSVAGSEKNASDEDSDSISVLSDDLDVFDEDSEILNITFDAFTNMKKIISQFDCEYTNIIREFADVEIFLISLDSLIVECAAHSYHNWQLAGQSIVLNKQIDRFLEQFVKIGGRFKIVIFTDLTAQFARDTTLSFARASAIAHLMSGKFADDILVFTSPVDASWGKFLDDLTPSFLMISTDNVTKDVCAAEDVNLTPHFETIVIDVLSRSMPVVLLNSIRVNFVSVDAYYVTPKLVKAQDWECFLAAHWECNGELLRSFHSKSLKMSQFASPAEFWVKVIVDAKATKQGSDTFEQLCAAVLLSSLICTRRGVERVYLPERENAKRGLNVIRDRRLLLNTATTLLEKADHVGSKLDLADIWDGRMVLTIYDEIAASEAILPYRLQEEFAKLHGKAGLTIPLAADTAEKLFDPLPEVLDPLTDMPILYDVTSPLLKKFVPEIQKLASNNKVVEGEVQDYAEYLKDVHQWRLKPIEESYAKKEEKIENLWQLKKANRTKQNLMKWYELFANSLEGRGSNLLVDFSRVPKGYASLESENSDEKKSGKGGWVGQKGQKTGGGGKKGKEAGKSKKDAILEANKKVKDQKVAEGEKAKIRYGCQQGKEAISFLNSLYSTLDLPECKAICRYEVTVREGRILFDFYQGASKQEERRFKAIQLVGHLKECFTKHWEHLEPKQREQIVDLWVSLGFEAPAGTKPSSEAKNKKLDLGINMIYYQLQYGGELIDIQSDPKKDDRVSGFAPDGWQRNMLDSVDRGNSALIIAPTSAGKTFVSYYCIEKILRSSDDDVVVYVSPSRALINQVCGSVYARFRNKSMKRGMSLFGTLTQEYAYNALQCQVLVTVPECLEELMLSQTPAIQKLVSNIKYVVFDEVHSIGASDESHIWERLLLLIQCPFLALSATIGNAEKLHEWLNTSEVAKSNGKRKVDLIVYGERYSELELSILNIENPVEIAEQEETELSETLNEKRRCHRKADGNTIIPLMPYGVYMPEKLKMFSIPDDQQLTARQILHLYSMMAAVDEVTKKEFEPCNFFGQSGSKAVWISRKALRELENALKARFLEYLHTDAEKLNKLLEILSQPVKKQLEYRAIPFNKEKVADDYIVSLVDEMKETDQLPAICFSENRHACEKLALTLCIELEQREEEYKETAEFKNNYAIKDEEKLLKLAKRKRDEAEKKKKKKIGNSDKDRENSEATPKEDDDVDVLALKKARLANALAKFKLRGRGGGDVDLYQKMIERLKRYEKTRESTKFLLRLFERGIGFHHAGLNQVEKGAVEVLFRSGNLAILFSTSTLSLGVNMPCKTVMFGVDTPQLTPLLYRQMSGRAGRRGFDHSGNVIFMSIPTRKIRRLLTASLSNLHGNPPFTTIFLLRLFSYVHQKDVTDVHGQIITTIKQRAMAAGSLLAHSFSLHTRPEAKSGVLQKQLKLYTAFSFQVLRHLQLLTPFGSGKNFADLAMFAQFGEAGTLLFIYLMQKGCFHKLLKDYVEQPDVAKRIMLEILANLFTNLRMTAWYNPQERVRSEDNYSIVLPDFPKYFRPFVAEYNSTVSGLYKKFMAAASDKQKLIESVFDTSGKVDANTFSMSDDYLVSPVFDEYSEDQSFLPVIELNKVDHRGNKIYRNAFAVDFFYHCSRYLLTTVNGVKVNNAWFIVNDFLTRLQRLSVGLQSMARPQDPLALILTEIHKEYDEKFRMVFGMRTRD